MFPHITSFLGRLLNIENEFNGKPINFLTHPNEFIEEIRETEQINFRSSNYFHGLWSDLFRSKLKLNNLGKKAIPIFEKEIKFFYSLGYKFITLHDYYKTQNP